MRKPLAFLLALLLSSSVFASDTFSSFNPGPSGPVQSNGTYKLVPFTGCSAGVPILSWTGACVASGGGGGTPGGANFTTQYNNSGAFGGVGPGTTTTVLHGNASAAPAFSAVDLTADVVNILPGAFGGTGNGFTAFTGPTASLKTFTLPNASATILTTNAAVTVAQGGTGVGTLTAHGILIGEGTGNIVATAALAADNLLLGQGAADPAAVALVNCGDATHALAYSTGTHTFACQAITATATPGGSTTQVQFNLSSAFAGDAGFTYVGSSTQTIALGTATTGPTIGATTSSSTGRNFTITGSNGGVGSDGGPINLTAGNAGSGGTGGALAFLGGAGNGASSGGAVSYKGGTPGLTGVGGAATLSGGPGGATSGTGGAASVTGGNAPTSGVGGAVSITGGTSVGTNQAGSNVTLTAGSPTGSGAVGVISLASPSSFSSSLRSIGTKFTLGTGTGACATSSTLLGGAVAGSFVCTGTAGASSQVINLPTLPSGGTSYSCTASDATSGVAWATQVGTTATGKIAGTITTTSDVVVFHCIGY